MTIAEIWRSSDSDSDSEVESGWESAPVSRVELVELYHLAPGLAGRRDSVGGWLPTTGAHDWSNLSIYRRRTDFTGLTLRVAVKEVRGPSTARAELAR